MTQKTQGRIQGVVEIDKGRSAVAEGSLAPTLQAEAIRQLFIDLLREGYIIRSLAVGESMSPSIKKGELLIVKPIELEEAEIGEIVASRRDESHSVLTTHRVVQKGKESGRCYIITKGDRNPYRDFPLVSSQELLGKVTGIERNDQVISLESPFYRLRGYLIARLSLGLWMLGVLKRKISPFNKG
ncbi:MAG: signal peptidase I [Acidobacteria bacterium]|nr:signal peptidase I [Acidobacteriota bacterium]